MKYEKGSTTLLLSISLAIIAMGFSIDLYKQTAYNIQRTKNQGSANKAFWAVEGTLECAYAFLLQSENPKKADKKDFFPAACFETFNTSLEAKWDDNVLVLRASQQGEHPHLITRSILVGNHVISGNIASSSTLNLNGALVAYVPDKGQFDEKEEGWDCVVTSTRVPIHHKNTLVNYGLTWQGTNDENNGYDCKAEYRSNSSPQKDFAVNSDIKPFEDVFGVSDANHNSVRDTQFDAIIHSQSLENISECGGAIIAELEKGKSNIWVEGHCEIKKADYKKIVSITNEKKNTNKPDDLNPIIILVHDGVFGIHTMATEKNKRFQGTIFHYNLEYTHDHANWNNTESEKHLAIKPYKDTSSFFIYGSMTLEGAMYLDAKQRDLDGRWLYQDAVLEHSLGLHYKNRFEKNNASGGNISWKQGSWHDW